MTNTNDKTDVASTEVTEKPSQLTDGSEKSHQRVASITSLSSTGSLESTEQLIASLSKTNLNDIVKDGDAAKKNDAEAENGDAVSADDTITSINVPGEFEPVQPAFTEEHHVDDDGRLKIGAPKESGALNVEISPQAKEAEETKENNVPSIVAPKQRKAIKFTVRKVSSDSITSPLNSPVNDQQPFRSTSYTFQSNQIPKEQEKLQLVQRKYDSYSKRIVKIEKEIQFLTNLLPPYNVEIDYATRVKILNAIEKLKMKQDEVEKKKYESGIVMSRLWRGQDENDLWVRNFGH